MGPDQKARFLARKEAREILAILVQITGTAGSEELDRTVNQTDDEEFEGRRDVIGAVWWYAVWTAFHILL